MDEIRADKLVKLEQATRYDRDNRNPIWVMCYCGDCEKQIFVEFLTWPTKEEKLGFYCNSCADEWK